MRTETPPLIHLADYRPSDHLIERVDLDVRLDPHRTRITAVLSLRPNPAGEAGAPLRLDGDDLRAGLAEDGESGWHLLAGWDDPQPLPDGAAPLSPHVAGPAALARHRGGDRPRDDVAWTEFAVGLRLEGEAPAGLEDPLPAVDPERRRGPGMA